ncbi:MAG TPA: hypothetical protein VFN89_07865 [Solirubrobacterales bacterium]|nr:hypothetical protein [Solirubrobacterales bacterium]
MRTLESRCAPLEPFEGEGTEQRSLSPTSGAAHRGELGQLGFDTRAHSLADLSFVLQRYLGFERR